MKHNSSQPSTLWRDALGPGYAVGVTEKMLTTVATVAQQSRALADARCRAGHCALHE